MSAAWAVLALLALWLAPASAGDLVDAKVDPARRVPLAGGTVEWARAAADQGAVPADLALSHLTLLLRRTPERQAAYEAFLRAQQDPASPHYQQWLTGPEIGERFGASGHDIDAVSAWLRAEGLAVDAVSGNRMRVRFSGSAGRVAAAFGTPLHYYRTKSGLRMANTAPPQVPAGLAPAVQAVLGISTLEFTPTLRASGVRSAKAASSAPGPAASLCPNGVFGPCDYFLFPADFAAIYNLGPVLQAGIDGRGQDIGIIARTRVYDEDVKNFQARADLPQKLPITVIATAGVDPGEPAGDCSGEECDDPDETVLDQSEATLDVQRAGSVAPGATVKLITSGSVGSKDGVWIALEHAIDTHPIPAKILSLSWGLCENVAGAGVTAALDDAFGQAAMQGISVFVASGDGGVTGCAPLDSPPLPDEEASVNVLCSSGHVTCVGGTQYTYDADPDRYWSRANDPDNFGSARGYIPEGAWNEPLDAAGNPQMASTGGGVSLHVPTPAWQRGIGVPGRAGRYTPDVSFSASTRNGYFSCFAAFGAGCALDADGSFSFTAFGGTSASAPSMAGVAALLNQKAGKAQANLNPRLYELAADPANGVFHDVTIASSGVTPCTLSPSPCNNSVPGPGGLEDGLAGFKVGTGYDLATGLGSLDVERLLARWDGAPPERVNLDQHGVGGTWANPATDGQGVVMQVFPDLYEDGLGLVFGGWFTYDVEASGGQRWYTLQGQVRRDGASASMPIYASTGGRFASPQQATLTEVGEAVLSFADCGHGTLSYRFNDGSARAGSIPLTRLLDSPTCGRSGNNGAPGGPNLWGGMWADPADEQQGLVMDIDPSSRKLFAAWYTFAVDAGPGAGASGQRWYTVEGILPSGQRRIEDAGIYATTGGRFDQSGATRTQQVGTATIVFNSCTSIRLEYRFDAGENSGQRGVLALQRPAAAPEGCSL
ncbi:MAG: S8/S53 family peptidase [Xanthomonadales bacterium]|nr:S8/S53 family peptidase [Xanthomonadales bacterium]